MKKLSIILISALVAFAACTKSKEVHPEIGDGNDEIVTVGMKDVRLEYTRTDHAELQKVVFHYSLAEAQQFAAAEMTKQETFFELTLNDLLSDTLYYYYYELFPRGGDAFLSDQKTFHTQAFDTPEPPTPPSEEHEYVDLGLPSGTLWTTCNIGANSPEEFGDYFAWGETRPKDYYGWNTYQYSNGAFYDEQGNFHYCFTRYCINSEYGYNGFTDNLTTLLLEDDAAMANWGSGWRMPTMGEWQELYDNTTVIWTTQNGVDGRLFTGSNGNSLFLPAAGYSCFDNLNNAGTNGYYWSSTLDPNGPGGAEYFAFNSGYFNMIGTVYRYIGKSVRAVRSAR